MVAYMKIQIITAGDCESDPTRADGQSEAPTSTQNLKPPRDRRAQPQDSPATSLPGRPQLQVDMPVP
jgi:hypothetical protein